MGPFVCGVGLLLPHSFLSPGQDPVAKLGHFPGTCRDIQGSAFDLDLRLGWKMPSGSSEGDNT